MITVTVYLDKYYKKNVDFKFLCSVTEEEIREHLNNKLGKKGWYTYDIHNSLHG